MVAVACVCQVVARPVRRTLNFNMFVLKPHQGTPDRTILATDGMSRFGPLMEYLVQRVQGMLSVRLPPKGAFPSDVSVPMADASENEIDVSESKMPGVVVRPSQTKPGTYEVEIDVVVDDGQPDEKKP